MFKMKTTIYFIRHGIVDKPKDTWAGIINLHFGLTEEGKKQIAKVGKYLSRKKIKAIYSSPIKRAFESAEIISTYFPKLKVIRAKELFEWRYNWKSRTESGIKKSKEFKTYLKNPAKLTKGEKIIELANRMEEFCKKILKKHNGGEIICVTHQDPIRALILRLQNKEMDLLNKTKCERGAIYKLYFENNKLKKINYIEPK